MSPMELIAAGLPGAASSPEEESARELAALRAAFDQSFAEAPADERRDQCDYVLVTAGGQGYALRAAELAGMEDDCLMVPVASAQPALAGLAGVRGAVVPVFDLAALLGGEHAAWPGDRASFALARVDGEDAGGAPESSSRGQRSSERFGQEAQQIGLAFETLERFLSAADESLFRASGVGQEASVDDGGRLYRVVEIGVLVRGLTGV